MQPSQRSRSCSEKLVDPKRHLPNSWAAPCPGNPRFSLAAENLEFLKTCEKLFNVVVVVVVVDDDGFVCDEPLRVSRTTL